MAITIQQYNNTYQRNMYRGLGGMIGTKFHFGQLCCSDSDDNFSLRLGSFNAKLTLNQTSPAARCSSLLVANPATGAAPFFEQHFLDADCHSPQRPATTPLRILYIHLRPVSQNGGNQTQARYCWRRKIWESCWPRIRLLISAQGACGKTCLLM
jgi:hypothetical protein